MKSICGCIWEEDEFGRVLRCQTCRICCKKAGYRIADLLSQLSLFQSPDLRSKSGLVSVSAVVPSEGVNSAHSDSGSSEDDLPF